MRRGRRTEGNRVISRTLVLTDRRAVQMENHWIHLLDARMRYSSVDKSRKGRASVCIIAIITLDSEDE